MVGGSEAGATSVAKVDIIISFGKLMMGMGWPPKRVLRWTPQFVGGIPVDLKGSTIGNISGREAFLEKPGQGSGI